MSNIKTSSLQYVRKNYTIYLKDEYGADMMYNPYGVGNKADHVFCLKCDYVESSHANNTGIAKFVNDCLYDTKTPVQLRDNDCRTAINGFPIEVYMNNEYLGIYNFNYDRYSYKPYGYEETPNMLVYEINSNSNTSAGAFHRFGDDAQSSANISELDYYKRDFNLIYSANRTTESDTMSEIKTLVEWVAVAGQDLFRDTIDEHFNREYLFRYLLCVLFVAGVDSLGKNLKLQNFGDNIWYPTFYDLDTVLGIDNSGYLTIPTSAEIEDGTFNTANSKLWSKVLNYFNLEIREEWAKMRQDRFTLENIMKYIYDDQIAKIPAKYYNTDAQVKYLNFGSLYTYCCHGNKRHHMSRWIRERLAYVDSMLDYFVSQDDQVTIRMNKTGLVTFDVTTYIPLYFSVKWNNSANGTQRIKMNRGETKTFSFNSTVATDQEVIVYHAQHIKRLDNLSNLNPSSCILSNAIKLNEVEIHSTELYNINVTNNKYLRRVDLSNCPTLGTVTATGSSLDLSNCKYLKYCDVRNTALTEIQLNTSGGSLKEIYYPKTIQSIELIKQRLLETIGLPYGENGADIPTALYNIDIEECPMINRLNMSDDDAISNTFASMIYCNNLTLRNALDLQVLSFDGFHRLTNVVIENMYNLEELGFNNLLPVGQTSTLKYVALSNCPKLEEIELNCTSDDYEITLANNAVLDFGRLYSLKNITSNCVLKGLKTLVVPNGLESMFFTNEYGSGYSSVENIWSSSVCNVSLNGAVVSATHMNNGYKGIDFLGMNLKNIDLGALVNIPKAINFSLSPTHVNPNFNLNRDGQTYPYLQPVGTLDLSNYTESLAKFFNGVDLDKLTIICNNDLPQNDLSYCFYNSTFSGVESINALLSRVSNITNLDYCFYKTTISDLSILEHVNMGANSTMNYTFAECPNIIELRNVVIPASVVEIEGLFFKCPIASIVNMNVYVNGSIAGLFKGCNKLETINTLRIPNVTSVASTFEGCSILSTLTGFELPTSCTDVSNLFNGCYSLTSLSMEFGENITSGENWFPPNLETLYDTNINTDAVKLTSCATLKSINNLKLRVSNVDNFFDNCSSLRSINGLDIGGTITSVSGLLKDMNLTSLQNITFGNNITNFTSCFENVPCVTDDMIINMPNHTGMVVDYSRMFAGCLGITKVIDTVYPNGGSNFTSMYEGCTGITRIENLTVNGKIVDAMFKGCSYVTKVSNTTFNNATSMNEFFMNCTRLEELDGVTFGEHIISANDWFKNTNLKYVNNMTLNNEIIKFTNNTTLLEVNDLVLGNNVRNISNMFANCSKLTKDTTIPSHITNCSNTFKNCTGMTHIHSNWNNAYTNGITPTDCYAGCTGITHINDVDLGVNEYKTGLDEVPEEWGGYGFEDSNVRRYCCVLS